MAVATNEDRALYRDDEMQLHARRNTSAVRAGGTFEYLDSGTWEATATAFVNHIVFDRAG
jgi:hypothetical protein